MSRPDDPYWVADNTLYFHDEELLESTVLPRLEQFAAVLNAARPDPERITDTLRALMSMSRGFTYTPGWRFIAEGEALRMMPRPPRTRTLP